MAVITKTVGPDGEVYDYTTLAAAEAGEEDNLVIAGNSVILRLANFQDTEGVSLTGWTTAEANSLQVIADDDHGSVGEVTENAYRLQPTTTCLYINSMGADSYVVFEGLQCKGTGTSNPIACTTYTTFQGRLICRRCVFEGVGTGKALSFTGSATSPTGYFEGCYFHAPNVSYTVDLVKVSHLRNCTITANKNNAYIINGNDLAHTLFNVYIGSDQANAPPWVKGDSIVLTNVATHHADYGSVGLRGIAYSTSTFTNITNGSRSLVPKTSTALDAGGASITGAGFTYTKDVRNYGFNLTTPEIGAWSILDNSPSVVTGKQDKGFTAIFILG